MTKWNCAGCTYANDMEAAACVMCQAKKPTLTAEVRVKTKIKVVTLPAVPYTATVADLRKLIESKTGIKSDVQRWLVGTYPPKEVNAKPTDKAVDACFIKEGDPFPTITVEPKKVIPAAPSKDSKETVPAAAIKASASGSGSDSKDGGASGSGSGSGAGGSGATTLKKQKSFERYENTEVDAAWDAAGDDWGDGGGGADDWGDGDSKVTVNSSAPSESGKTIDHTPEMLTRAKPYKVLTQEAVAKIQDEMLSQIDDVLGVSMSEAGILLRHYRYKINKLLSAWTESDDGPAKVRQAAGIKSVQAQHRDAKAKAEFEAKQKPVDCPLCLDTVEFKESTALACGHRHCNACWVGWLTAEMDKGPQAIFTTCMFTLPAAKGAKPKRCEEVVPEDVFMQLLPKQKKEIYKRWLLRGFIEGASGLRWCPSPKCDRALSYDVGGAIDVECGCGYRFCFGCLEEAHVPAPCFVVKKWLRKNKSDAENTDWIMANCKECPKCRVFIEKNQGCNHMTCKNCKHEFCWLCKGDWTKHGSATGGYYKCNVFEDNTKNGTLSAEQQKAADAKTKLEKYIFYFRRYQDHHRSAQTALNQIKTVEAKMEKLQDLNKGASLKKTDFLLNGVKLIIECRRTLQWSYAMGYYIRDRSRQKTLFEQDQAMLEKFADHLHELCEKKLEELATETMRKNILNYSTATAKFLTGLHEAVVAGTYHTPEVDADN